MPTEFTPIESLIGGGLIGLATVMLMLLIGRVMGATGVLAGFMVPNGLNDWLWRAALLAGMLSGPVAYMLMAGNMPAIQVPVSNTAVIIGGFLVGVGVTFGGGCTSGHGVCGMARLSPRSFAAVGTFMVTAAITVYIINHVIGG